MKVLILTLLISTGQVVFSQYRTLYNKNKQITYNGIFNNGQFQSGLKYFYKNDGTLDKVQYFENGIYVRDTLVTVNNSSFQNNLFYLSSPIFSNTDTINLQLRIDTSGNLTGKVNPSDYDTLIIEQFRWKRWTQIDTTTKADYSSNIFISIPVHSGENIIRISALKNKLKTPVFWYSHDFGINPISIEYLDNKSNQLKFSDKTLFQIYDQYGNLVKKGFTDVVNINLLRRKKLYYICYDNKTEIKKLK